MARFRAATGGRAACAVAVLTLAACAVNPKESGVSVVKAVALATTSAPAPTTTTVPPLPVAPRELWSFITSAGLLEPWNGVAPLRPAVRAGLPTGTPGGVDLPGLAGQTATFQAVTFEALADKLVARRVVLGLHADPSRAAAFVTARAALFPPEQNATAASSTVSGAVGHLYRPTADGPLYVNVRLARGPVDISVDVREVKLDPVLEPATLAAADATVTAVVAAIDARLATCGDPCKGANGPTPASAVRPLQPAECAVFLPPGPDFVPPAQDTGGVACSDPHAVHAVIAVPTGDDPKIYETTTTATLDDHPFRRLVLACRAAVVQWITATGYQPTAGGTFGLRVQLPARATFDGGDRQALCVLTPADPGNGELLNGFALPG